VIGIRDAAGADVPRLLEIRYTAFARHAPSAYSPSEVTALLDDVDEAEIQEMISARQLFVACSADAVVGLAGWKDGWLRHVYVAPGHERRGIATGLVAHVEADLARRTGARTIRAGVGFQAEAFYRAIGYAPVQRLRAPDGSEYLEMARRL
jgi:GNAT superfamily N-acetyltransferase